MTSWPVYRYFPVMYPDGPSAAAAADSVLRENFRDVKKG
jgi:hypothetical protein